MQLNVLAALSAGCLLALAACAGGGSGGPSQQAQGASGPQPSARLVVPSDPGALTIAEYGKEPGPRTRARQPLFESIECRAGAGETCGGSYSFSADPGYQVCWMAYEIVEEEGESRVVVRPAQYVENDPQSPDRFRGATLEILAKGASFSPAAIRVENGFFWLLPESSTVDDRRAVGCRLPLRG
jgi:hypothetical protein